MRATPNHQGPCPAPSPTRQARPSGQRSTAHEQAVHSRQQSPGQPNPTGLRPFGPAANPKTTRQILPRGTIRQPALPRFTPPDQRLGGPDCARPPGTLSAAPARPRPYIPSAGRHVRGGPTPCPCSAP
jgi:hypothetical protein